MCVFCIHSTDILQSWISCVISSSYHAHNLCEYLWFGHRYSVLITQNTCDQMASGKIGLLRDKHVILCLTCHCILNTLVNSVYIPGRHRITVTYITLWIFDCVNTCWSCYFPRECLWRVHIGGRCSPFYYLYSACSHVTSMIVVMWQYACSHVTVCL